MNVSVDSEVMGQMIGAAVMNSITQEQRNLIVQDAIKYLLTPEKPSYGDGPKASPIQKAFNQCMYSFAQKYCAEQLDSNEDLKANLRTIMDESIAKVFGDAKIREKILDRMTNAIADSFGSRY